MNRCAPSLAEVQLGKTYQSFETQTHHPSVIVLRRDVMEDLGGVRHGIGWNHWTF